MTLEKGGAAGKPSTPESGEPAALLQLPPWLWGYDVAGFAAAAGWSITPTSEPSTWQVRLIERTSPDHPARLRTTILVTPANAGDPDALHRLRRLAPLGHLAATTPAELVRAELDRLSDHHDDLGSWLSYVTIKIHAAPHAELERVTHETYVENLLPNLPASAMQLIELDTAVSFRVAALRALLFIAEHGDGVPTQAPDGLTFASAEGLTGDLSVGLSAYLSPLFLSHTPWVWGMGIPRPGGVIVVTFGQAISGRRGQAADVLQLFSPTTARPTALQRPTLTASQLRAAVRWWVARIDVLLVVVFDPSRYMGKQIFDARRAYEVHLGVEQLFRSVQSLSIHDRDPIARRTLFFDALDTLSGLTRTPPDRLYELTHAETVLNWLTDHLPSKVAPVLLPRAAAAVDALRQLQAGFFLDSRLTDGGLRLPNKKGGERTVGLDAATAQWLRMLRNAGHGFSSSSSRERDSVLLVAHDGRIPHDLPDLAYLYLLDLLCHPHRLQPNHGQAPSPNPTQDTP